MAKAKVKKVKVTQIKSSIGRLKNHKACISGLGLRRIGHTVEVEDTPSARLHSLFLPGAGLRVFSRILSFLYL